MYFVDMGSLDCEVCGEPTYTNGEYNGHNHKEI